mgnify:FL=1
MAGIRSLLLPILSSSILACGGAVTNTNGGDGGSRDDDGGFTEQPQTSCEPSEDEGPRFYVTTDGDDDGGDGSEASPWGSIAHAIENISDGSTLLVGPGTYNGAMTTR